MQWYADQKYGPARTALEFDKTAMPAEQFLRGWQSQPGAIGSARNQGIEHRVLQVLRYAGAIIFDFNRRNHPVPRVSDREAHDRATSQGNRALTVERHDRIPDEIQKRLHDLVAIEVDERQAWIVVPDKCQLLRFFRLDDANNILEQLVYVDRLFVRWSTRSEQSVDESGKTIGLADDDIRVLLQLVLDELPLEQLRRTADAAERILNFVCKLPDHLPAGTMLYQQRIFAADFRTPRDIHELNQKRSAGTLDRRDVAIHDAFVGMHLGRGKVHFIRIVITCFYDAAQDIAQLGIIIDETQQGLPFCTLLADAENVLGGRVQADDQQARVKQDDARTQAVEYALGFVVEGAAVVRLRRPLAG